MTFAFFLVFSIYSSLLSSYFFLFSLRMCLLVSLLLVLLFSFLNHFYCLCLICLISLFSLFDASDFHVQSTLMFWQIKPQEGKKKGKCLSLFFSISLLFLSCSFIHSFVLSLFLALTLPHSLALSASLSVSPLFSQLFVISPCLLIYLLIIHFESLGISSLTGSRRRCQQVVARWILATSLFSHLYQSLFFLWSS